MSILIKNGTFIDWKSLEFRKVDIVVEEGATGGIRFVDGTQYGEQDFETVIDADSRYVTKSFGCGHHHIYSTLARGMPAPPVTPANFLEILKFIWWHLDKNLDREMIRASALSAALACLKNGTTFVIDHHASPFAVDDSLFTIREAFDSLGLSHLLCYEISDRDGEAIREKGLAETATYLRSGNQGHVGLHASFTAGDELVAKAVSLAAECGTGIHVHVAEDLADQQECQRKYGTRVVKRFQEAGMLELQGSIFGHCIHLDEEERAILRMDDCPVWIVQNVESNLNNSVGMANYSDYGERILLGTDGMHSDMLRSAKASFLTGQTTEALSFPGIYQRFRSIHHYLQNNSFKGDGDNNLVILDYQPPTPMSQDNFLGHFVYGLESSHVESVISSGRLVVENRRIVLGEEEEILLFARQQAERLWRKMS